MSQHQQIIDKCKQVVAKAKELYDLDLSNVRISFDLRGRSAGRASGKGYRMPGSAYHVRFNRDMLTREAFDHLLNDTVPHELAHVVCFMNPELGKNHDYRWAAVCRALGGTGARTHNEEVVYGNGRTYEYVTDRGHKVRLSEKRHRYVQTGGTLSYRMGKGKVTSVCAYSIVGHQGRTLTQPIVKQAPNHPDQIEMARREAMAERMRSIAPDTDVAPKTVAPAFNRGESKASIARAIMLSGHSSGKTYEQIIDAIMVATGHNRQLSRAYYKNNAARVGVPQM
jgi:predicted SprT family Zn-dependent metalloprotease